MENEKNDGRLTSLEEKYLVYRPKSIFHRQNFIGLSASGTLMVFDTGVVNI